MARSRSFAVAIALSMVCRVSGGATNAQPSTRLDHRGTGQTPKPAPQTTTVYVTKTGEKYHRETCRSLRKSRIEITVAEAKRRGFTACKVCKPPA